uniref:(northern house mosquito) hypothetical protein n=1 Tax=Culex pipiens TaxID=7175 RepID=A0A8D8AFT3_CULPI
MARTFQNVLPAALFRTVPSTTSWKTHFQKRHQNLPPHGVKNSQPSTHRAPNRIDQAKDRYQAESSSEQVVVGFSSLLFCSSLSRSLSLSSLPFSAPHQAHSLPCFIWMFFSAKFSRTRQPRKVGCFSFFSQGDEFFLYYTG